MKDEKLSGNQETSNKNKLGSKRNLTLKEFQEGLKTGNTAILARAITLVESTKAEDKILANQLVSHCLSNSVDSVRIGVTGIPGVGKSTFIENIGSLLLSKGKKVAVIAIDPSSNHSSGSILGDKTRMPHLAQSKNAFVRPSPTRNALGGVTTKTRETIVLCEAAGFNVIFIETVGVGQSETAVYDMVDFFLLLNLAGTGDELQGIKRGIIEIADAIAINKADGDNLKKTHQAQSQLQRAMELFPDKYSFWKTKVSTCSAMEGMGIDTIWKTIQEFVSLARRTGSFEVKRKLQREKWLYQTIDEELRSQFFEDNNSADAIKSFLKKVRDKQISAGEATQLLMRK
ncbi:methylmalonyl Co-A mutase-associated GTPase MeaB [Euzebyella saccharophila]|uniref:Methylmalonyl Co-A mutase-associated GTPase MeaB n=1 Tax=Euzebyella saccharophila TaxID=679664 RepID=A0ABV8JIY0_9FLAO|nr:methylmalonyl Co-A mutase-associated GTPase MeaB [Euzebyella saccharophila]